jgi:hypothetical protein
LVYARGRLLTAACRLANDTQLTRARRRLEQVLASGAKTIEQVCNVLVEAENHSGTSA